MRSESGSGSGLAPSQVEDGLSMEGTIQPSVRRLPAKGSVVRGGQREHPHLGLGLGALAQHQHGGEHVHVLDAHAEPVGHHLAPRAVQVVVGCDQDAEVERVLVGQRHEPAPTGAPAEMVDAVLDTLAACHEDAGRLQGPVGRDGRPLGGVRAVQADEHEGLVAARADAQGEPAVGFLHDEDVGHRVAAQPVTPQLEGAQRLVQADVEDVVGAGGPGQPVARVSGTTSAAGAVPASSGVKRSSYFSSPARSVE